MAQHGKRYRDSRASFDREELYSPVEVGFDNVKKLD